MGRTFRAACLLAAAAIWIGQPARGAGLIDRLLGDRAAPRDPVERLAKSIDLLEAHIDGYGSVVAKQPDVWGEARLMKYRQEYERIMAKETDKFKLTYQAAIRRSDEAYLASALSLSAAISGAPATAVAPATTETTTVTQLAVPDATDPASLVDAPNIMRTDVATEFKPLSYTSEGGLSLEPTIVLDQMDRYLNHLNQLRRINEGDDTADSPGYSLNLVRIPVSVLPGKHTREGYGAEITVSAQPYVSEELLPTTFRTLVINDLVDQLGLPLTKFLNSAEANNLPTSASKDFSVRQFDATTENRKILEDKQREIVEAQERTIMRAGERVSEASAPTSFSASRRSRFSVPPSQLGEVFGNEQLGRIANLLATQMKCDAIGAGYTHLPDVQAFLREELQAAYDFLSLPESVSYWHEFGGRNLLVEIRKRNEKAIGDLREGFLAGNKNSTQALAWAILVEATLLDQRLKEDIQYFAGAKECCLPTQVDHLMFYLPDPGAEEREVFRQYVLCRWPIHVFALDPVAEQQNVQDLFSRRREMQLAMALAFASGQIGANTLTRYVRRLETDIQTVDLNRTAVAFSHGPDVFGWRFYPRVQTPPFPSNAEVIFREMLIGGDTRERDYRRRQLEPGMRECTAIVLMPSFVPYALFDVRSNWFKLGNPKKTKLDLKKTVEMSRQIQSMHEYAQCAEQAASDYRPGEVRRLLRRVDQLSAELPLQSMLVEIPFDPSLGGFEMFASGVSDLSPELIGFYGSPGIDLARETALFLVGDNFSVHQTRVIVGNLALEAQPPITLETAPNARTVPRVELLSRQIIQVIIPPGANLVTVPCPRDPDNDRVTVPTEIVDVHVATPYGVSSHLEVPVVAAPPASNTAPPDVPEFHWSAAQWIHLEACAKTGTNCVAVTGGHVVRQEACTQDLRFNLIYDDIGRSSTFFPLPDKLQVAVIGVENGSSVFSFDDVPAARINGAHWAINLSDLRKPLDTVVAEFLQCGADSSFGNRQIQLHFYVRVGGLGLLPVPIGEPVLLDMHLTPRSDCPCNVEPMPEALGPDERESIVPEPPAEESPERLPLVPPADAGAELTQPAVIAPGLESTPPTASPVVLQPELQFSRKIEHQVRIAPSVPAPTAEPNRPHHRRAQPSLLRRLRP